MLFCCTLFVLYQLLIFFSFSQSLSPDKTDLRLTADHRLGLGGTTQQVVLQSDSIHVLTENNHIFAPFFFFPVAINYCDKELLMSVKGIGPALAEKILQTRKSIGYFMSPKDLLMVQGIGPVKLLEFTPSFSFIQTHE